MNATSKEFRQLMKSWRAKRRVSQLELSLRCEVSQKHISFLESARTAPSSIMVSMICEALDMPLRDRNTFLMAAGFAPSYRESDLTQPEMAVIDQAINMMLAKHEPYPAMVVDRYFNVIRANGGAMRLQSLLYDVDRPEDLPELAGNVLKGLFHKDGYRRHVSNWQEIAPCLLRRLQSELYASGDTEKMQRFIDELAACEGVPEDWKQHLPGEWLAPVLTVNIAAKDAELSFFSTIATLGTPLDVTLQEIRIESYFPANEATRKYYSKTLVTEVSE